MAICEDVRSKLTVFGMEQLRISTMWCISLLVVPAYALLGAFAQGPLVSTNDGQIEGTLLKDFGGNDYEAYFGIPFAKPPVGSLRFANPQVNDRWVGVYDATVERSECLQKNLLFPGAVVQGSEDCLYLNVYKPCGAGSSLPVMFNIHGGGYFGGSASKDVWGPERLMEEQKVILVVAQYRLGVFGFLSTGDAAAPGNFGMKDQVMALRWVQKNIRNFGGDPSKVTIFGESAGSSSVQLHLMSPMSRGLFQKAIMMSGSTLAHWSLPFPDPLRLAQAHAKLVGIANAEQLSPTQLVNRLRTVDGNLLTESTDLLKLWSVFPITLYRPVLESSHSNGSFLCEDPRVLWENGNYANVPLMIGTVPNDGAPISIPVLHSEPALQQVNSNASYYLPFLTNVKPTPSAFRQLKQQFFPTADSVTILPMSQVFLQMISESWFFHAITKTIKQRVSYPGHAPTIVYSFEFRGRHSYSSITTGTLADYGICHQDELLYLFHSPRLFPNFPVGSPEAAMAKQWTKFFVNFATARAATLVDMCLLYCRVITFSNSGDTTNPVRVTYKNGLDEDMYTFWESYYNSQKLIVM